MTGLTNDIERSLETLKSGGIILYPTDTIWGIGCDATNPEAVQKIFDLKQREDAKTMIILISPQLDINRYVTDPSPEILKYVSNRPQPVTAIYEKGKNIAQNLLHTDGTVAIRITRDDFCSALINKLNTPLVSTSANISGKTAPANFSYIDTTIKKGVDYIVQHRRSDFKVAKPSAIIKLSEDGKIIVIRP